MPTYPQRLPAVNSDDGTWGNILDQYLNKEHYNGDANTTPGTSMNGGHMNITIQPGTTSAAPITFSSGTNLTTATAGAMEYDGSYYYLTTSSATRKKLAIYNDASGATGDTYYRDGSGNFTRLAAGSTGNMLTIASGIPSWTASIVGMALNNTNSITVKDASLTLQNATDTTKQANFSLAGNTTGTTRTYTLPDITDTLAAKGRDVDPLWQRTANMIYDGSFETTAAWAKAFGTMTTSQFYNGKQSRQLTATGGGVTVDRITLTHDGVGNPISVELIPWAVTLGEIQLRKSASNTGTGNLYLRVRYKDGSGVEQVAASVTIAESAISSSAWTYFNNITYTDPATQALKYYFTLEIDSTVPSGNVYYLDQTDFVDIGMLTGWQGTLLSAQNLVLDNTNSATLKDSSLTIQNATDTTKQANFSLAGNTTGTTRTYTLPDATTTLVGIGVTQTLTGKTISGASNTLTALPYDFSMVGFGSVTPRTTGTGDFPFGIKLQRNCTLSSVTYRCNTADASGNLVIELRKNGSTVSGSSATVAAANQVAGGTATGTWSFSTGDILTVYITGVGTTPGNGLIADITGVTA